ncbi:MAG: alpha/beta hydrolase [Rhodospirillales bacterium]|nr:alpha/beta hydrolase [Rhodospirillales bacterium]
MTEVFDDAVLELVPKPKKYYVEPDQIEVSGIPTAYRRKGAGEPVLFLHGHNYTRMWLPLYERLSQSVDLIAPEHPGFGETPGPAWLRNFDDLVLHYDEFRERLGLDQVHVVGYDVGGWLAAEIASFYPRRIKSLTLITPMGLRLPDHPLIDVFKFPAEELLDREFNDKFVMDDVVQDPNNFEEAVFRYGEMSTFGTLVWSPRYNLGLERRLQRLTCPSLVIQAENDRIIPNEMADRYAEVLPNSSLTQIPGTGHAICIERANETADAIIKFVTGGS